MMGDGKDFGVPIYTYRNFRRQEGLTVENALLELGSNELDRQDDAQAAVAELESRFPKAAADPAHYLRGYIFLDELVDVVVDGLRKAGWSGRESATSSTAR